MFTWCLVGITSLEDQEARKLQNPCATLQRCLLEYGLSTFDTIRACTWQAGSSTVCTYQAAAYRPTALWVCVSVRSDSTQLGWTVRPQRWSTGCLSPSKVKDPQMGPGLRVTGHWVNDFGRVGSGHGLLCQTGVWPGFEF